MSKLILAIPDKIRLEYTAKQSEMIKKQYESILSETKKEINKLGTNLKDFDAKLKSAQLRSLQKNLDRYIEKSSRKIESDILNGMSEVAKNVVNNNVKLMDKVGLKFQAEFSNVPDEVVKSIRFGKVYGEKWYLSEAIWGDVKSKQNTINKIISKGIAENKSVYDIAEDLKIFVDPNAKKNWQWSKIYPRSDKVVDYNAQRLSRTLTAHAYQQSAIMTSKPNPFIIGIKWHSAFAHDRTCELCKQRATENKYGLGVGVFPKNNVPLDHPNGLCTMSYVLSDSLENIGSEIGDWYNGKSNEKLDNFASALSGGKIKTGKKAYQETLSKNIKNEIHTKKITKKFDRKKFMDALKKNDHKKQSYYDEIGNGRAYNYIDEYYKHFENWYETLSSTESKSVNIYTGGSYSEMNGYLRKVQKTTTNKIIKAIEGTKKALSKSILEEEIVVRRGSDYVSLNGISKKLNVGNVNRQNASKLIGQMVEDEGFMSTSPLSYGGFSPDGVEYVIKLPKGAQAAYCAPISQFCNEQEILINAGTKFIIQNVEIMDDQNIRVFMEAIIN